MADDITVLTDIIDPQQFNAYVTQRTALLSPLFQSNALTSSDFLNRFLAGPGTQVTVPSWQPLAEDASNVAHGTTATAADAVDIATSSEMTTRMMRSQHWGFTDLLETISGDDPAGVIGNLAGDYWAKELEKAFVSSWIGVLADNNANDGDDMFHDTTAASYTAGVTDFNAEGAIDAMATAGMSQDDFVACMVHPTVYAQMKKQNLIDFEKDSEDKRIEFYQGMRLIKSKEMPTAGDTQGATSTNAYETWFIGADSTLWGTGIARRPLAIQREEQFYNGGGQEVVTSRVVWALHPRGFTQTSTPTNNGGGFSNATLETATTWDRAFPQREQIKFAAYVTREAS